MAGLSTVEIENIRKDFPILASKVHGKPLVYLDNAASAQKPRQVIESLNYFYANDYSNVHRGVHALSERATNLFEAARDKVKKFISAAFREEIIWVRGTTEAINLVAQSFVRPRLLPDDEIIITHLEHHANIVPWQMVCEQTGAKLKVVPITDEGEIIFDEFIKLINPKTKFISISHISNALGTINPVEKMIQTARDHHIPVMLDGAQAVVHQKIDVQVLDCDFYAFSSHKLYAPSGIGVLYGRKALLEKMVPYQGGGEMINRVTFEKTTYSVLPYKFEAGTPHIAGAIGLAAAIDYLEAIGFDNIHVHEKALLDYAIKQLKKIAHLRLVGTAKQKASIISFIFEHIHAHDVGTILDQEGVAVRTGHHCAMPLMARMNVPATARASFAFYNTFEEVDLLVSALEKVKQVFHE